MADLSPPQSNPAPSGPSNSRDDFSSASDEVATKPPSRDRSLWRLACTPTILVLVGPSAKPFYIQRGLLRKHSIYFRALLRNDFVETQENTSLLPEDDVLPFGCFVEWLYLGDQANTAVVFEDAFGEDVNRDEDGVDVEADTKETEDRSKGRTENAPTDEAAASDNGLTPKPCDSTLQFACYVLADKLQSDGFKAHIVRELGLSFSTCQSLAARQENLTVDHIRYAYRHTPTTDDQLRKFCVDMLFASNTVRQVLQDEKRMELCKEDVGAEIMGGVLKRLADRAVDEDCHLESLAAELQRAQSERNERVAEWRRERAAWNQKKQMMAAEKDDAIAAEGKRLAHKHRFTYAPYVPGEPPPSRYGYRRGASVSLAEGS